MSAHPDVAIESAIAGSLISTALKDQMRDLARDEYLDTPDTAVVTEPVGYVQLTTDKGDDSYFYAIHVATGASGIGFNL
jgi:hypothetical protein